MRKSYLFYNLAFVALFAIAFQSCKKENGIDNNSVIKTPYGLYVSDNQGSLLNTNDGINYKTIFPRDGYPIRAITIAGTNLLFIKSNVHLSENNGGNFNPTYLFANPLPIWQSMILNAQDQQRIYLSSIASGSKGIVYSEDNGKTWTIDNDWDDFTNGGNITSFAELANGTLFSYNYVDDSLYQRDNKGDKWTRVIATTSLPSNGAFYINHHNNDLLATDITGTNGVWVSSDNGLNWAASTGLPNRLLYATATPFDQVILVGTDSMGVYRYQNGTFVSSNHGLEDYTTVYGIVGKNDIYKNDVNKQYIYLATDKGIYRSDDMGQNWYLVKPGVYYSIH